MKMKRLLKIGALLALAAAVLALGYKAYVALTDQSHLDETFYQVESDHLVTNVRAVFLSDLHLSEFGQDNATLVARVQALQPDLILIGGDMNKRQVDDYSIVLSLCRRLLAIAPTYYALGNHEVSRMLSHERDIYYDLQATGVTVLHNTYEKVTVGGNTLYLAGVSQQGEDIAIYSGGILETLAAQDGFKLLLSHYPSNYKYISPYDIDLVLSGHLHGGQINLPYFDGLYSPEEGFFPDYTEGQFEENGTTLIVSRGLGNSSRLPRVNNNPELVIIDMAGSAASYHTMRLLARYDAETVDPVLTGTDAQAAQTTEGAMLGLMQQREEEMAGRSGDPLAATPTPLPEGTQPPLDPTTEGEKP